MISINILISLESITGLVMSDDREIPRSLDVMVWLMNINNINLKKTQEADLFLRAMFIF